VPPCRGLGAAGAVSLRMTRPAVAAWLVLPEVTFGHLAHLAYPIPGARPGRATVVFLNHLTAVLDNWDPRVVDGIAAKHPVITFDNRGIGASEGKTADE